MIKYVYEEPIIEDGVRRGINFYTYSEEKILQEYWDIWCTLKEKDGHDPKKFRKQDCIDDWIKHFDAKYVN